MAKRAREDTQAELDLVPSQLVPSQDAAGVSANRTRDWTLTNPTPMLSAMFGGYQSSTGVPVTPLSALQATAVWGCVKAISEDLAKLEVSVKRRVGPRYWVDDYEHPIAKLLIQPNRWMTWFEFVRYMVTSVCLRGNALGVIKRGWGGVPEQIIPVPWDQVAPRLSPAGHMYYNVSHPALGWGLVLHMDDVIHVRGQTFDGGYVGTSPITAAQDAVGLAIAAQQHGAVLFRQGAQISGVLTQPEGVSLSREARDQISEDWKKVYGGVQNAHRIAVLEGGLKYEKLSMTNEEAQFLASRNFQVLEICRLYRVPPHKVQDLSRANFSNIEASEQQYINDTLQPIATNIEQLFRMNLLTQDEWTSYKIEFNFVSLLRGDRKSRYEAHGIAIDKGFKSINDVRAVEGDAPIAGGDTYRVQVNTAPVGSAAASGNPATPTPIAPPPADADRDMDKALGLPVEGEVA